MGNADREFLATPTSPLVDSWAVAQLDDDDRAFLAAFEPTVSLDGVLYCHATPHSDEALFTRITPEERVRELLEPVAERTVVCGHTHVQFDRRIGDVRVVNAGSVGMPYGTTDACWALAVDGEVELRRTVYDLEPAAERLRASGHGMRERLIAENVLATPSAEDATEFFEAQIRD
jgi:diadenosine tetraphosphatase ApaH/serine/threonine PP2A family protein phosphatase